MQERFDGEYLSPTAATLLLIGALSVFVVLSEVSIWATFMEIDFWDRTIAENTLVTHEATANGQRKALVDGFHLFFFAVSCLLFFRWLGLMARNARALGAIGMRYGPRSAIAWWFVPIFHLWKPLQVMKELFQASHPDYLDNWPQAPVPRLLSLWWTLWITFQVTLSVAILADVGASTPGQVYMAAWGSAIVSVFAAPLGVAAAIVAWRLRSLQAGRARCTAPMRVRQPWPTRQSAGGSPVHPL